MYTGHAGTGENQLTEIGCMEVVQLASMSAVNGPTFTGVEESSDDYSPVDLELGAEADAPLLSDIGLKPPKGAAGLGDSALDFIVDVGLMGQGACQVSEFVHIIEHFTIYCDVRFHMGLARAWLVLMVRPKLSHTPESLSVLACIACSLVALRAQSSVKRKSLMAVSFILVAASSVHCLKSFPTALYMINISSLLPQKASVSIAENMMLKSVCTIMQPCLTPLVTGKASDVSLSSCRWAVTPPLCNWPTMVMNLSEQPNLAIIFQRPSLLMVSKAFVRSRKVV